MARPTRITAGRKYGRLMIIGPVDPLVTDWKGLWKCKCDCGKEIEILGKRLDWIKSCGCLAQEGRKQAGKAIRKPKNVTITYQYRSHVHNSEQKGIIPLKKEDWLKIVFEPCYYCGETDIRNAVLNKTYQKKNGKTLTDELIKEYEVKINGVDRINSDIDYEEGNCVPCCMTCNYMKNDYDQKEFLRKIKLIYLKHFGNESNKKKHPK